MAIAEVAKQLVDHLSQRNTRVVFAESCTGGLISAELAKIAGVSDWLCGSAVTYRSQTKVAWLGVSTDDIEQHTAVSKEVAIQMAVGVLERTPEASLAASITGHFGPGAPRGFDGVVFIGIAERTDQQPPTVTASRHQLALTGRPQRQREASELVMHGLLAKLSGAAQA